MIKILKTIAAAVLSFACNRGGVMIAHTEYANPAGAILVSDHEGRLWWERGNERWPVRPGPSFNLNDPQK